MVVVRTSRLLSCNVGHRARLAQLRHRRIWSQSTGKTTPLEAIKSRLGHSIGPPRSTARGRRLGCQRSVGCVRHRRRRSAGRQSTSASASGVGTTVGIAGESGSGKSTLAHAIATLTRPPAEIVSGSVEYFPVSADGKSANAIDIVRLEGEELRKFRWEEIAVVFQSALNALNPVLSIRAQLTDTIRAHRPGVSKREAGAWAGRLLDEVGVTRDRLDAFPHQLSGGMRQRVMIAMALALQPRSSIMDEPTTALDVVTQRQILKRIAELQTELNFAMVFITHDLSLLLEIADVIAVMYAGELVEVGHTQAIYRVPAHPYTAGLLESSPPLRGPRRTLTGIPGLPPDLHRSIQGAPLRAGALGGWTGARWSDRSCSACGLRTLATASSPWRAGSTHDAGRALSPEAVAPGSQRGRLGRQAKGGLRCVVAHRPKTSALVRFAGPRGAAGLTEALSGAGWQRPRQRPEALRPRRGGRVAGAANRVRSSHWSAKVDQVRHR